MFDRDARLWRQSELETLRQREERQWREIAMILRPDDQDFDPRSQKERDGTEVYDSTPLYALDQWVGGLFGQSTNPAERWAELTIEDKDLAKWGPVKTWLWEQMTQLYQSLSPSVSGFYSSCTPWFSDVGAFGNGVQYDEEGNQGIVDLALPLGECYWDTDLNGNPNEFHRKLLRSGRQIKEYFARDGYKSAQCNDDSKYLLIHCVFKNPDFREGMLGNRGKPWLSVYLSPDLPDLQIARGYYEFPFHIIGWNPRSGRAYATGPGHNARADMNTLNESERAAIVSAQFEAEPIWLLDNESTVTAADIAPNALLYGTVNEQGKQLLQMIERKNKGPREAPRQSEQRRTAIREAFHFSLMQLINRPQMTATEWVGWNEEKLRLLGPNLVRVQGALARKIARRFNILHRARQTLPPPRELQGRPIAVEFVSPLAKAQKLATGRAVLQWIGAIGQMAAIDPQAWDIVDVDGAGRLLHEVMTGVPGVILDDEAVAQKRKARAELQARQMAVEEGAQTADTIATISHALQAKSAADKRARAN